MPFQFQCPQGHLLEGDKSQAGQQCHCPTCGMLFIIPQPIGAPVQITSATSGASKDPRLTGDGGMVTFSSSSDLTNENADHNSEVFLFDVSASETTQVTGGAAGLGAFTPTLSEDGDRLAFQSDGMRSA